MGSATKVNAEMCKDSVRLFGAVIVVENMPTMMASDVWQRVLWNPGSCLGHSYC